MTLLIKLKIGVFLLVTWGAIGVVAYGDDGCARLKILSQQAVGGAVAQYLGMPRDSVIPEDRVHLLAFPCNVAAEKLFISSITTGMRPYSWLVRLHCLRPQACLPFYALVDQPSPIGKQNQGGSKDGDSLQTGSNRNVLVEQGSRILLSQSYAGMRLVSYATCLDAGNRGQSIRVRRLMDGRQLLARIIDSEHATVE